MMPYIIHKYIKLGSILLLIVFFVIGCLANQEDIVLDQEQPNYLSIVAPSLDQIVDLATFQSGKHYPTGERLPQTLAANKICVEIIQTSLLEAGDYFSGRPNEPGEFFPERLSLTVNGEKLERDDGNFISGLNRFVLRDESGEIVASALGPQVVCWQVNLEEGTHVAVLDVRKTSGAHVSYTWAFTLAE